MIDEIFTGIQKSCVKCAFCGHESITIKPYSCLSLPFEKSLNKSLSEYFRHTQFDSNNKYKCEKCSKLSKAKLYSELEHLP